MKSITLIGSGNLATHLGLALKKKGFIIAQVYSRKKENSITLAKILKSEHTNNINNLMSSDLTIICIKDNAIRKIIGKIRARNVIHTSGSVSSNIFQGNFKNYGVIYPLQTFNKHVEINFEDAPICVEANNIEFQKKLIRLSKKISNRVVELNSNQRKKLHLSAVFACNFSNHMFTIAEEIMKEANIEKSLLLPLIKQTIKQVEKNNAKDVQTGPAKRHDKLVMKENIDNIDNISFKKIYKLISSNIMKHE